MIDRDRFYFRVFCITFWVVSCIGFVSQELLPFLDGVINRPVVLLADIVAVVLGLATLRNTRDKLYTAIFFVLVAISNLAVNHISLLHTVNGIRDYIPLLFWLPVVRYFYNCRLRTEFRESFEYQLKVFLVLQAPCLVEQCIRYGAGDHGGGTYGNFGSGIISTLICLISYYFVSKRWNPDRYMRSLWENRWYILLLFPIFLNETKVSFIYLAIYFGLLYKWNFKSVGKVLLALPMIAAIGGALFWVYISASGFGHGEDVTTSEFMEEYLGGGINGEEIIELAQVAIDHRDVYDEEWGFVDIPRFLKLGLLPDLLANDTRGGNLLGAGVGHLKGGTYLELTPFAIENEWLFVGTVPLLMAFWMPLGVLGIIWLIAWILHAIDWKAAKTPPAGKLKLYLGLVVFIMLFYNDALRYNPFPIIFYWLCLASDYPIKYVTGTDSEDYDSANPIEDPDDDTN